MPEMTIEQRVTLDLAARRYLRASERLGTAAREFETAADELRDQAENPRRFVIDHDYRSWLIQINQDGDLDAECIERI